MHKAFLSCILQHAFVILGRFVLTYPQFKIQSSQQRSESFVATVLFWSGSRGSYIKEGKSVGQDKA